MSRTKDTVLVRAWRRASRRRRWYALAAVFALVAVTAPIAILTHHRGHHGQPLSEQARAVLAMQRAAARENLAIQARLRARAAAKR
jgi:hypothetical protein